MSRSTTASSKNDHKSEGREIAVEALVDMHESGPAYRVGKIINEGPEAALAARPIRTTKAMLLEEATSLSQYELKGEYLNFPSMDMDMDRSDRDHADTDATADVVVLDDSLSKDNDNDNDEKGSEHENEHVHVDGYSTPPAKKEKIKKRAEMISASASVSRAMSMSMSMTDEEKQKLVKRHHAKIMLAKNTAYKYKTGSSTAGTGSGTGTGTGTVKSSSAGEGDCDQTPTPTSMNLINTTSSKESKSESTGKIGASASVSCGSVFPPPQLVSSLRKIYGSNTVDSSISASTSAGADDNSNSNSNSASNTSASTNVLPGLLRAVFEHDIFEIGSGSGSGSEAKSTRSKSKTSTTDSDEMDDSSGSRTSSRSSSSTDDISPGANIETIVGNACFMNDDSSESFRGILVAALSVLTSSVLQTPDCEGKVKTTDDGSRTGTDRDRDRGSDAATRTQPPHLGIVDGALGELQVSGPLSHLNLNNSVQLRKYLSGVVESQGGENLLLDDALMNYFNDASAVYEKRIDLQKANLLAKLKFERELELERERELAAAKDSQKDGDDDDTETAANKAAAEAEAEDQGSQKLEVAESTESADQTDAGQAGSESFSVAHPNPDEESQSSEESIPFSEESSSSSEEDGDAEVDADGNADADADADADGNDNMSEDDDSDNNYEEGESEMPLLGNRGDPYSSSSESESEDEDEQDENFVVEDDDDDDIGQEDEAYMLEQALALSLTELNSAIAAVALEPPRAAAEDSGSVQKDADEEDEDHFSENDVIHPSPINVSRKFPGESTSQEEMLPKMPIPPKSSNQKSGSDDEGNLDAEVSEEETLNPSSLFQFGKLPAIKVLVSLLLNALGKLEHRRTIVRTAKGKEGSDATRNQLKALLEELTPASSGTKRNSGRWCPTNDDLHLMIAFLHILSNARTEGIDMLLEEYQGLDNSAPSYHQGYDSDAPSDDGYNTDDPAFAVAVQSSESSSAYASLDSLEAKGMMRKAAAAAQIAEVRREKTKGKIESLLELVHALSLGSYFVLRSLRLLLQDLEISKLIDETNDSNDDSMIPIARLRLSASIAHFTTAASATKSYDLLQKIGGSEGMSHHSRQVLISKTLLLEATALWGECAHQIAPSRELFEQHIRHLIECAFPEIGNSQITNTEALAHRSLVKENLDLTWSENDESLLKMDALCRRLRSVRVLDFLIPRPTIDFDVSNSTFPPNCLKVMSYLEQIVMKELRCVDQSMNDNIKACFYSLCHRINEHFLLWNGFNQASKGRRLGEIYNSTIDHTGKGGVSDSNLQMATDPSLVFDSQKCAESIAIVTTASQSGSNTVNQRANKSWGTVLSSKYFEPKTGIHRWAVRMTKCERGHIFLGVATSRASTKTYVGGDKHGWGLIATQALWHDKKKIRSDYGNTFRTGATIVVTLDTDAGTLSYALWREGGKSGLIEDSPAQELNFESADNGLMKSKGFLEDWGIAFEGLPLDTRLCPAVGLYQRDDKATLIGVKSIGNGSDLNGVDSSFLKGRCYFPSLREMENVRQWNSSLCEQGIVHAATILNHAIKSLSTENEISQVEEDCLFGRILPSIASSLGIFPSMIPTLSGRAAYTLLPIILKCLKCLDEKITEKSRLLSPMSSMKMGQWIIRASPSTSVNVSASKHDDNFEEEYIVKMSSFHDNLDGCMAFSGVGAGTSGASTNEKVSIKGRSKGNILQFVEEWSDSDTPTLCSVDARLSMNGLHFEGMYTNDKQGTKGIISGVHSSMSDSDSNSLEYEIGSMRSKLASMQLSQRTNRDIQGSLVRCSYLLGLAASHLSLILDRGAPMLDIGDDSISIPDIDEKRRGEISDLVSSSCVLTNGLENSVDGLLDFVKNKFQVPIGTFDKDLEELVDSWHRDVSTTPLKTRIDEQIRNKSSSINLEVIDDVDSTIALQAGGLGSLSALNPQFYQRARKSIIMALLHHNDLPSTLIQPAGKKLPVLIKIWRSALHIIETGIRSTIMKPETGASRGEMCEKHCTLIQIISALLLDTAPAKDQLEKTTSDIKEIFFSISDEKEVDYIRRRMQASTRKGVLKLISLSTIKSTFSSGLRTHSTVEVMLSTLHQLVRKENIRVSKSSIDFGNSFQGATSIVQNYASSLVNEIYHGLSVLITRLLGHSGLSEDKRSMPPTVQSLILTIFACFFTPLKGFAKSLEEDALWNLVEFVMVHSGTIKEIGASVETGKKDVDRPRNTETSIFETAEIKFVQPSDYTAIDLLKTSTHVLHTTLFQLQNSTKPTCDVLALITNPIALLKTALLKTLGQLSETDSMVVKNRSTEIAVAECTRWNSGAKQPVDMRLDSNEGKAECNESTRDKSLLFRGVQKRYLEKYLTQLLNALASLFRNRAYVATNADLILCKDLLAFVVGPDRERSDISRRFSNRILRMLRVILPKCAADEEIARLLISYVGGCDEKYFISSVGSKFSDKSRAHVEAKETVSLIRYLYSHVNQESSEEMTWRRVITSLLESQIIGDEVARLNVMSILGGLPGGIAPGTFVLLKPDTAKSLSTTQSKGSNEAKSQNSASAIVAGGGMESIVSGLCRKQAKAGMISSVDESNLTCEVVLFERKDYIKKHSKTMPMAVRAMRVSCSDVTAADEIPILQDGTLLLAELTSKTLEKQLLEALTVIDPTAATTSNVNLSILAKSLRSSMILLSNRQNLEGLLACDEMEAENFFPSLLTLSSMRRVHQKFCRANIACSQSLRSLPDLESRYWHLKGLQNEVQARKSALTSAETGLLCLNQSQDLSENIDDGENEDDEDIEGKAGRKSSSGSNLSHTTETPRREEVADSTLNVSDDEDDNDEDDNDEDDDEDDAEDSTRSGEDEELAHLREASIVQMAELGLPRSWSEYALRRVGGTNIEAAVHFCLERGADMERLLAEEHERNRLSTANRGVRRRSTQGSAAGHLLQQLVEMGFPSHWCAEALAATGQNVDEALTWILTNGERLNALDEGGDDDDGDDDDDEDDEDEENEENDSSTDEGEKTECVQDKEPEKYIVEEPSWPNDIICPLRSISGRANINSKTLEVTGLPAGGFSSVGTKGVLLTTGKWYYECVLVSAGCIQIGWADSSFAGHCHADRGDGCGDGPSSWAYDGWRRYRWHSNATEYGCRWQEGDVVGCLVDMDRKEVAFTLNGKDEEIGMGLAFSGDGFSPCGGVYACVSFNRRENIQLVLGGVGKSFHYPPPIGYKAVGEAILAAVSDRKSLLEKEDILKDDSQEVLDETKKYVCNFSDGEHGHEIFAWQHRYYGSDASVHLGVGQRGRTMGMSKSRKALLYKRCDGSSSQIDRLLVQVWKEDSHTSSDKGNSRKDLEYVFDQIKTSYDNILGDIEEEFQDTSLSLSILYARKLMLHVAIVMSSSFRLERFCANTEDHANVARRFMYVIEVCCSLHAEGWVGEAGAMSMASEALGLAISSNERSLQRGSLSSFLGGNRMSENEGKNNFDGIRGAITQVLNAVILPDSGRKKGNGVDASDTFVACAETVLGGEGGCSIIFLQYALKNILRSNESMVAVMIAYIRQAIRNLSVIDYQGNDAGASNEKEDGDAASDNKSKAGQGSNEEKSSDARLVSFLTGLLLTSASDSQSQPTVKLIVQLCQAWSVGLQSASAPWRMICMMTISSIMGLLPKTAKISMDDFSPISNFFERMESNVVRRIWAERAAAPIFSRYLQSMVELLNVMNRFPSFQNEIPSKSERVDAATPLPLQFGVEEKDNEVFESKQSWEGREGWVCSDKSWEIWTGAVEYFQVEWAPPSRSAVRSLMDAGEGPPMLREGCSVLRGVDWDEDSFGDDDGRKVFEAKKTEREEAKKEQEDQDPVPSSPQDDSSDKQPNIDDGAIGDDDPTTDSPVVESPSKKKKKIPLPKLPVGRVISIEPWNGIPGVARRVRWDLTGKEGIYRYGGDGGRYDIVHIEVNDKGTRVTKRHPHSETAEQCSARHGFGTRKVYNIILRLRKTEYRAEEVDGELEHLCEGIIEWPDFGAGIAATCRFHEDGAVSVTEGTLIYGPKDSGWEGRFGQPSYVPGTTVVLSPTNHVSSPSLKEDGLSEKISNDSCQFEELLGSTSFTVNHLRNRENGEKIRVACEMRLVRGKEVNPKIGADKSSILPPISFDRDYHSSSLQISRDGRTVTCTSAEGRNSAFLSTGFSKGIHYFEVKIEQADVGSVFIGVAEKPKAGTSSGGSLESRPRLKGWYGLGFVNFRATYNEGSERVYGSHCHAGDTIGVLLDCDAGRLSYFFDGVKYGEHILNDLGCAFENISPFGFNADGCGGGGASQGAPSGEGGRGSRYPANGSVRPKALWPVIGLRHVCDRVTISKKWMTSYGIEGSTMLRNAIRVDEVLRSYQYDNCESEKQHESYELAVKDGYSIPDWFIKESYTELKIWEEGKMVRTTTRAAGPADYSTFGLHIDVDTTPLECAAACASLGLECVLLPGDKVSVKRSAGRLLELAEEAEVLGAFQGKLWYKLVSQKSEGGSLTEGGGRAWFWDESEVVDRGLQLKNPSLANKIVLSPLNRFKCSTKGGIRVTYSSGAVLRSDVEINEEISSNIGIIPEGTIIPCRDIIERRVNSCGVVRFHVLYEPVGTGWISLYIRGGDEERILEILETDLDVAAENKDVDEISVETCSSPHQSAQIWLKEYTKLIAAESKETSKVFMVEKFEEFQALLAKGVIEGLSPLESDTILCDIVTSISDHSPGGNTLNCPYRFLCPVLFHALKAHNYLHEEDLIADFNVCESSSAHESASSRVAKVSCSFPPMRALLCRIAMLRALNRRAKYALPLYSLRPPQEDSAVLGGCSGFGASVERLGKTEQKLSGWIQAPSIGKRLRALKTLFFTSVKRSLFDGITGATTTATSLSQDEYELPRDIRTVRVNRLKARKGMNSSDRIIRRKNSVFGQLQTELRGWTGAALRRGYVAKGHGGQKRAFKVKLIGEGVNDYSGPYREIFTDAISDINDTGSLDTSTLGILDPSPNGSVGVGESRNLKVFASCVSSEYGEFLTDASIMEEERLIRNHFSSHLVPRNERVRDLEDSLSFLGKLVSTAVRHGIPVDLSLPLGTVWKRLSEEDVNDLETFHEIDLLTFNRLQISKVSLADDNSTTEFLACQQHFFNAFADGLSSVLPVEVFSIFTAFELRDYFCGNQEIDVELLRSVVDYEGYDGDEEVIQYFWEVLREFTTEEKKLFLQFVWARSRLPLKASDFEAPFKIQKDTKSASYEALPSASTCFFSLSLPEYTSREMLRKKLLFAIKNVKTMETDFSTNDVEVEEGWRGL